MLLNPEREEGCVIEDERVEVGDSIKLRRLEVEVECVADGEVEVKSL
jgi:hypothetical protein